LTRIFKFGGASVKNSDAIINLKEIVSLHKEGLTVIVVSAIDKTTNQLEEIWKSYLNDDLDSAIQKTNKCIDFHYDIINNLVLNKDDDFVAQFNSLSNELKSFLSNNKKDNNLSYSKIVSYGELWSTCIISSYLNREGYLNNWVDARKIIKTKLNFIESDVDWEKTNEIVNQTINKKKLYVTQGFISSNSDGLTTTLGREGSDFTASIIGTCLAVDEVVIWKDVDGLLNADPKWFDNTKVLKNISYKEAIELSYLGASVIHPNTVKPLQNKKINLRIKSFLVPSNKGSLISESGLDDREIPSLIYKPNQFLLSITTKDYSFVFEEHISEIFSIFSYSGYKVHLMQNSALSFSVCGIISPFKLPLLIKGLQKNYKVKYNEKVDLLTIRHYNSLDIPDFLKSKEILIQQRSRSTIRFVFKDKT
jgi:aspartate kinase|tara:strand:- start:1663 stop:2925 length:1263 start_codon:yes stop_codon:yes gene_type:complete